MNQIPGEFILMFLGMVFIAAFLLSQGVVVPVFGEAGKMRKRIRGRLHVLEKANNLPNICLLYTSPSPRDGLLSRMPSSA